jgi:hypothetical protein
VLSSFVVTNHKKESNVPKYTQNAIDSQKLKIAIVSISVISIILKCISIDVVKEEEEEHNNG